MPEEVVAARVVGRVWREVIKEVTVERVIRSSILVFLFQPGTDLNMKIARHGYIATVKKPVQIASEQKPVTHCMWTRIAIWLDVCCLQRR
jgi:hypothetical protein